MTRQPTKYAETPESFAEELRHEPRRRRPGRRPKQKDLKPRKLMGPRFPDRDAYICDLVEQGITYTEIGKELGITRERVRQIVDRRLGKPAGGSAASRRKAPLFLAFVAAVRRTGSPVDSWRQGIRAAGGNTQDRRQYLEAAREFGMLDAIDRLFRARKRLAGRRRVLEAARDVARLTGRAPRMADFYAAGTGTSVNSVYKCFDSFSEVLGILGYPPNPKGYAVHGTAPLTLYDQQRLARGKSRVRDRMKELAAGATPEHTHGGRPLGRHRKKTA